MKDKKGNILNVGDVIKDIFGDISRIKSLDEKDDLVISAVLFQQSTINPDDKGIWDIEPYLVEKISEEEASFFILGGKL